MNIRHFFQVTSPLSTYFWRPHSPSQTRSGRTATILVVVLKNCESELSYKSSCTLQYLLKESCFQSNPTGVMKKIKK